MGHISLTVASLENQIAFYQQAMGFKLRQQLPFAWLRIVPRAMHGLPEEKPRECARLVRDFVAEGGRGWAAYETLREEETVAVYGVAAR